MLDRYLGVFDVYRGNRYFYFTIEKFGAVLLGTIGATALGVSSESACDAVVWGPACVISVSCALLLTHASCGRTQCVSTCWYLSQGHP
jgi:hypothetical protein